MTPLFQPRYSRQKRRWKSLTTKYPFVLLRFRDGLDQSS